MLSFTKISIDLALQVAWRPFKNDDTRDEQTLLSVDNVPLLSLCLNFCFLRCLKEHKAAVKFAKTEVSAVAERVWKNNHQIDF